MKYFSIGQQGILFALALFLLTGLYFTFYLSPRLTPSEESVNEIVVEVLGEVRQPGVYLYHHPPNVREAIERAGGLREAAQFDTASSSTILEAGTLLTVTREPSRTYPSPDPPSLPSAGEGAKRGSPSPEEQRQGITQDEIKIRIGRMAAHKLLVFSLPLDLNHASAEDLCLIPGIGESLALEIIAYRGRRKGFRAVEELKNIKGIGGKKYEAFKKFLAVRNER